MSSRVRLLLQDFGQNTSFTGKMAYQILEGLYKNWVEAQGKPRKATSKLVWKKLSDADANLHPFLVTRWRTPQPEMEWEGAGYYWQVMVEEPPSTPVPVTPLPDGPRWVRALEMWSRLAPGMSERYRLLCSRDNRKHAWKYSLSNPWVQQWGFKARKVLPKKMKKAANRTSAVGSEYGRWDHLEEQLERPNRAGRTGEAAAVPAPAAKPGKPRVGIWI